MIKELNFDMDGTIANLYGVDGWLDDLEHERTRPYELAKPMVNMNTLAKNLNRLQRKGYRIRIITWTSKRGTNEYNMAVAKAKKVWLAKHLSSVKFDDIIIIPYGTPKYNYGKGILWDDEQPNREAWQKNGGIAYNESNILEIVKSL